MSTLALACPQCGSRASGVTNSRPRNPSVFWRSRKCKGCGHIYHTFEVRADLLNGVSPAEIDNAINVLKDIRSVAVLVKE